MNNLNIGDSYYNWKIIGKGSKTGYLLCECQCNFHTQQEFRKSHMKANESAKKCKFCKQQERDLSNKTFNRLTVLRKDLERTTSKHTYYKCLCNCGNPKEISVRQDKLIDGSVSSCGCYQKERVTKDLSGQIIGDWKIIQQVPPPKWETRTGAWWKLECILCGEQKILKGIHINENRVGNCSKNFGSKGEIKIRQLLQNHNILFQEQYTFSDLKPNGYPLRFDFAILNSFKKPILLIEYQGEQHYRPVEYFGGEKRFLKAKENDEIKRIYCKNKNIPLICIPYTHYDELKIEDLLLSSSFIKR